MDWRAACAAVIPCLNEATAISPLVEAVRGHLSTVLIVDDGSTDQTSSMAREAGAIVLQNPRNLGKGAALQAGWGQVDKLGFAWALTLDGDGQHSPDDIPKFFHCAEAGAAALVVGNRMGQAQRVPAVRRWVNRWMSRRLSLLCGRPLPDSQCGFRLMKLEPWSRLRVSTTHFEIESEVLFLFATAGLGIEFVPIQVIYKQEQSKIHPWRDSLRWFRWYGQARRRFVKNVTTLKS